MRLFGRKQHVNAGQLGGLLADPLEGGMFAKADFEEVLMERVGQSERSRCHGCLLEVLFAEPLALSRRGPVGEFVHAV